MKRSEKKKIKNMLKACRAEAEKLQLEMEAISDQTCGRYAHLAQLLDENIRRQKEIVSMLPDSFSRGVTITQTGLHATAIIAEISNVIFRTDTAKIALRSIANTFKRTK